jgi:hypothetical protein
VAQGPGGGVKMAWVPIRRQDPRVRGFEPLRWHPDTSTQPTRRPRPSAGYLVRGVDETLEHVAADGGISFLARSATMFYSHPEVIDVPIPDLASDQAGKLGAAFIRS